MPQPAGPLRAAAATLTLPEATYRTVTIVGDSLTAWSQTALKGALRGIPGLAPLDHLSNLSALRIHYRPRDAPDIGVAAVQQGRTCHLNAGRTMRNDGI